MSGDPLWYKDAVFYELSVRAFCDSDSDGVGDFRGLLRRLDYLQDLGVSVLWLQPFQPSPHRDGGYDVSDFTSVHPEYGTVSDVKAFLAEAKARGLRVVTDLALNHTSDRHPWFERARRAPPGSRERAFYVWSESRDRYAGARILFPDREASNWTWDPVAGGYYWHRFYAHEPDLNFDSAEVRQEMTGAALFWLETGFDGLRLDAAPFLYEEDGTACEDLPATHEYLRSLRQAVDRQFPGRVLLTEADFWPEDAARYFGTGDECHLAFHTPLMPRLYTALQAEDRHPIVDLLAQTPALPDSAQWVLFLRNHDELSLEMVTDEERDLMYRAYAPEAEARLRRGIRRRLAPLLGGDRRRIELLYGLLFALPGAPAIYYGDELGMGDNVYLPDRDSVRTPMQWSAGTNAGFSEANPQRLYLPPVTDPEFSYVAVNVAAQEANPRSLLWWVRRLAERRRRRRAFARGDLRLVPASNRKVLAFVRQFEGERVLVAANLSRHVEHVELDLSDWRGLVPVELSGGTHFPAVRDGRYALSLGPHACYWFALEDAPASEAAGETAEAGAGPAAAPRLRAGGEWDALLKPPAESLAPALAGFLTGRRWFAGKARTIRSVVIADSAPLSADCSLVLARVDYAEGEPETYVLPLGFAGGERAGRVRHALPGSVVAELEAGRTTGLLYAAEGDPDVARALLEALAGGRTLQGRSGTVEASVTGAFRSRAAGWERLQPSLLKAEQSNSSIRFGEAFILKLFRKVEPGINPDLEVGAFLTERAAYPHTPPVCGSLVYRPAKGTPMALAILQGFVANEGDAWRYTLDLVGRFFEDALEHAEGRAAPPAPELLGQDAAAPPAWTQERLRASLEPAALLGRRTAGLHRALASDPDDAAFAPEPFSRHDQRALYQSQRNLTEEAFALLRRRLADLPEPSRTLGERVLGLHGAVLERCRRLLDRPLSALRTRTHGDYHLGQVLWTGRDFVIIDFEGEPARPAAIRRAKRSPLRDVAGMLRSYHYAANQGLSTLAATGGLAAARQAQAEPWARFWYGWAARAFLDGYLDAARGASFLPRGPELDDLLVAHVLEKAVYELSYELNNRPAWVGLPLQGIAALAGSAE